MPPPRPSLNQLLITVTRHWEPQSSTKKERKMLKLPLIAKAPPRTNLLMTRLRINCRTWNLKSMSKWSESNWDPGTPTSLTCKWLANQSRARKITPCRARLLGVRSSVTPEETASLASCSQLTSRSRRPIGLTSQLGAPRKQSATSCSFLRTTRTCFSKKSSLPP